MNILYDLDGTLIISNRDHAEVICEILNENGKFVHADDMLRIQSGTLSTRLFSAYLHLSHNKPEEHQKILELDAEKWSRLEQRIPNIKPIDGAFDFIKQAYNRGFNQGIVSVSNANFVQKILDHNDLSKYISSITTAYETGTDKHHSGIFFEALHKSGFKGSQTVLFDDSARAIRASKITGMKSVAVCGTLIDEYRSDMTIGDFTRIQPEEIVDLIYRGKKYVYYPKEINW